MIIEQRRTLKFADPPEPNVPVTFEEAMERAHHIFMDRIHPLTQSPTQAAVVVTLKLLEEWGIIRFKR